MTAVAKDQLRQAAERAGIYWGAAANPLALGEGFVLKPAARAVIAAMGSGG